MPRILVVEDDDDVRPVLDHMLRGAGHSVATANCVEDARSMMASEPFDMVIADVVLPDGSGLGIADAAQAAGIGDLVITGYVLRLPFDSLAAYEYLMKPVRTQELLRAVNRRLGKVS
jgi:DNA-binding NtrC family response regulator